MSTVGPSDNSNYPPVTPLAGAAQASSGDAGEIDPRLIQQTKNEIRGLVQEITQLSQSEIAPDRFYEEFLSRVVQALASSGGAFWSVSDGGHLKLEYQINLPAEEIVNRPEPRKRHTLLLKNMLELGQPTLVPPNSGSSDTTEAGNPTEFLLVLANVRVDQETRGVIEIFQRPGGGPTTQRGYLRFLVQMSELAGNYLKSRRLRQLGNRQSLWQNLEQFLESIHRDLDLQATAYTLVNESRRLIGCDRVSVTVRKGPRQEVLAVSSLDSLDRRSDQIKRLRRLAKAVAKGRRPIWHGEGSGEQPPQIEEPLQQYIDRSHATLLAVFPLFRLHPAGDQGEPTARDVIGTLVVEQMEDNQFHQGFRERVESVARHGSLALSNAVEHNSLFLLPLWKLLGKSRWVVAARNLPKSLAAVLLFSLVVLALALVPADFTLVAEGQLQPAQRREVFAYTDGVVVEILVDHEQAVDEGDVLLRLANNELDVRLANLYGRQQSTRERIRTIQRLQLNSKMRVAEQDRLDGELLELEQTVAGLDRELALLHEKQEHLTVRSPLEGQVATWNARQLLQGRPVRVGQALMTIVHPGGSWQLELEMPERRMGHLFAAQHEANASLPVSFVLASHPEQEFQGTVLEVDRAAHVRSAGENSVRIKVAIDEADLPELRGGTTVTGRVLCGQRSLGFVVFHELIEAVQKQVLLWF